MNTFETQASIQHNVFSTITARHSHHTTMPLGGTNSFLALAKPTECTRR
eukprot:COSAG01_NODE_218_length_21548_cov_7.916919_5_plen_49_part_00